MKKLSNNFDISLSKSFLNRSRCKFCGGLPLYSFRYNSKFISNKVSKRASNMIKSISRKIAANWIYSDPIDFNHIKNYIIPLTFNIRSLAIHANLEREYGYWNITKAASCGCGESFWLFEDKNNFKPHIYNRKCKLNKILSS